MTWCRWSGWMTDRIARAAGAFDSPLGHRGSRLRILFEQGSTSAPVASTPVHVVGGCSSPTSTLRSYIFAVFDASRLPCVIARAIPSFWHR
jgi:hypothetical protein